jgi:hypothetical protein
MDHWFTLIQTAADLLNLAAAITTLTTAIAQRTARDGNHPNQ